MATKNEASETQATKQLEAAQAETAAALQVVHPAASPALIQNDPKAEVVKGNQRRSSGWVESPAYLVLRNVAVRRLHKVATQQFGPTTKVHKIRAARLPDETRIFIYPTDETDPAGIKVNYNRSNATMNLISLLGPSELTIETGYKEAFEVHFAKPGDPVYPALVFDVSSPIQRKLIISGSKSGAPANSPMTDDE